MPVNEQTVDGINIVNTKNLGEMHGMAAGALIQGLIQDQIRANQNATHAQQQGFIMHQTVSALIVNKLMNLDPTEALALTKANTGNDLAQQLGALISALGAGQVVSKEAGNTPPVTP